MPNAWRRRVAAFGLLYGYQFVVSGLLSYPLSQWAAGKLLHFPQGDALAITRGGLYLGDLWHQLHPVLWESSGLLLLWPIAMVGALFPVLHWFFSLLPPQQKKRSWCAYQRIVGQCLIIGLFAWIVRGLLWAFGYTSGLTLLSLMQQNPDERMVDAISWLPLIAMIPVTLGVSAVEGLTRLALAAQHTRHALPDTRVLGKPTSSDALAIALAVCKRHGAGAIGLYIAARGLALTAIILGAWTVHALQVQTGELWATGLSLVVHQLVVLATLVLHCSWQWRTVPWVQYALGEPCPAIKTTQFDARE